MNAIAMTLSRAFWVGLLLIFYATGADSGLRAQTLDATDPAQAPAPAEPVPLDGVPATPNQVSELNDRLLARFADADAEDLEPLRMALSELAEEVSVRTQLSIGGELPSLPVNVDRALQVVEQRRRLNGELELLRQTVESLPDPPVISAPDTLAEALLAVDAMTRRHEISRLQSDLALAEKRLGELDEFLAGAQDQLNPSVDEVTAWSELAEQDEIALEPGSWPVLSSPIQLSSAAAELQLWLQQVKAQTALRIASSNPEPTLSKPAAERLASAVAILEQAYSRADRRLNMIADDGDVRAPDAGAFAELRKQMRKIDQESSAFHWLVRVEQRHWEAVTPFWQRRASNVSTAWQSIRDGIGAVLNYSLFEVGEASVTPGGALRVMLILFAAWFASRWIRRGLERYGQRRPDMSQPALYAAGRVVHYTIIALGIGFALAAIGLDLTKVAIFASALGVGIGFGLQTVVNNFISGLLLLFERSLKIGDFVELESGVTGEITDISIRATRVTTNDNIDILVPNSEFVNGRVTSWTLREISRRIRIPFGVAYGVDKELVKKAALEAAASVPFSVATEGPRRSQVWLVGFGDNSLDFELVVWLTADAVKRPSSVEAAYYWALEDCLEKYEIEIPFPQRDLHVRTLFGLKDETARDLWSGRTRRRAISEAVEEDPLSDRERKELSGNDALDDALADNDDEAPKSGDRAEGGA